MIGIRTHNVSGDRYRMHRNIKQYIMYVMITARCILFLSRNRYCIVAMDVQLHMQSVFSIQQYVIKFVSDLRQIGGFGFLRAVWFPPTIKLTSKM